MNDHAANSAIAHQQIRSAPDHKQRQILAPAKSDQLRERRFGARLDPELRRPAHAQRRMFRKRFVEPDIALFANNRFQLLGDHEIGGERRQLFVNISSPKAQNEIAGRDHVSDVVVDPAQLRLITHAAMTVRRDFIRDRLARDPRQRFFACWINIGNHDALGVIERAPELTLQRFRPRVAMRLEHRQDSLASRCSRCGERRGNFRRMMRVIVHEQKTLALVFDLEPPARVLEPG